MPGVGIVTADDEAEGDNIAASQRTKEDVLEVENDEESQDRFAELGMIWPLMPIDSIKFNGPSK